jgi:hypothetical protein
VRTELVLAHRENQARTVEGVEKLVGGRREALEAVEAEVERAKVRYDQHIRQVVGLLGRRFRDVCEQARMVGEIEIVPAEIEGEFGIDVKVARVTAKPCARIAAALTRLDRRRRSRSCSCSRR